MSSLTLRNILLPNRRYTMLCTRIRDIMISKNITIQQLADMANLPVETVKNVYYGKTNDPKVSTVLAIANAFQISVNCLMGQCQHTAEERKLLQYYRLCGTHGKSLIGLTARHEATVSKEERVHKDRHMIPCLVPSGRVNHGFAYTDSEVIEVSTVKPNAYVAIKIVSNSYVPAYCKGDILLIEDRYPDHGERGVFVREGVGYIRKFMEEDGKYILRCVAGHREDIILKDLDSVECVGTCIGVSRE